MDLNGKENGLRRSTRLRKPNPKYTNGVASSTRPRSTRRRSTKRKIPGKANYKKPTRVTLSNMRSLTRRASKQRNKKLYARRMQTMKRILNERRMARRGAKKKANELAKASGIADSYGSNYNNNGGLANLLAGTKINESEMK